MVLPLSSRPSLPVTYFWLAFLNSCSAVVWVVRGEWYFLVCEPHTLCVQHLWHCLSPVGSKCWSSSLKGKSCVKRTVSLLRQLKGRQGAPLCFSYAMWLSERSRGLSNFQQRVTSACKSPGSPLWLPDPVLYHNFNHPPAAKVRDSDVLNHFIAGQAAQSFAKHERRENSRLSLGKTQNLGSWFEVCFIFSHFQRILFHCRLLAFFFLVWIIKQKMSYTNECFTKWKNAFHWR